MHFARTLAIFGAHRAFDAAKLTLDALEWAANRADDAAYAAARVEGRLLGVEAPELRFSPTGIDLAGAELARMTARIVEQGRN